MHISALLLAIEGKVEWQKIISGVKEADGKKTVEKLNVQESKQFFQSLLYPKKGRIG